MKHTLSDFFVLRNIFDITTKFGNKTDNINQDQRRDEKFRPRVRQTFLALGPLLLTVGLGTIIGFSAILIPQIQSSNSTAINIDREQASWIASIAALPMIVSCIFSGILLETLGRRTTHIISCVPSLAGWLLIYFSTNLETILAGRFLTGSCIGLLGPATAVYIGETSEPHFRGFLLGGISSALAIGLLLVHLLGTFLHWQTTALICCSIPVLSFVLMLFVPESPIWLAKQCKIEEAKTSFTWCRGFSDEATKELNVVLERQQTINKDLRKSLKEEIKELLVSEFLKPLLILTVFIVANQWAGVNAITFYTVSIMKETVRDGLDNYLAMILVDVIRVLASILACVLMKKFGRRPLALISGVGTFVSLFVVCIFTYLSKEHPGLSLIPMVALVSYISFISVGFIPLPWAMMGEVFPVSNRSIGSGISSFMAFTAWFTVVKTTPSMFQSFGPDGTFLVYGLVALVGTVFVFVFLPETKNKKLHEIEDHFKRKTKSKEQENVNRN